MNKTMIGLFFALSGSWSVIGQQTPPMITLPDEHIIITNLNSQNISLKHTIGSGFEAWFIQKETVPDVSELLSVASTVLYNGNGSNFPFKGTARIIINKPPINIDVNLTFNTNITTPRSLNNDLQTWKKKQIKQLLSPYNKRDLNTLEPLISKTLDEVINRWKQLIIYIKDATNSQIQGNPIKMQEAKLKSLSRELKDF
jgi:hypothetical protein